VIEVQFKDKVVVALPTGVYYGEVLNSHDGRELHVKYAISVHSYNGFVPQDGVIFAGDSAMTKMEVF
jgi:hypothetical protein